MKSFLRAFLYTLLFSSLLLAPLVTFSFADEGLITVINSDTTWTVTSSPYDLTAGVIVNSEATLTIEAGVTVNFNGNQMRVDGNLRVLGSSIEYVYLNGADISFTESSAGWNEQTGSGIIFDYAVVEGAHIYSPRSISVKISNCDITGLNSTENTAALYIGDSSVISNNVLDGLINVGDYTLISNNHIIGRVYGHSLTFLDNTIVGGRYYYYNYNTLQLDEKHDAIDVFGYCVLSNNIINGTIYVEESEIKHNIINGIVNTKDNCVIMNNAITGQVYVKSGVISKNRITSTGFYGYGITIKSGHVHVYDNVISSFYSGITAGGDCTIEGNLLINNGNAIDVGTIDSRGYRDSDIIGSGDVIIRNNTLLNNLQGIVSYSAGGSATIERNLIANTTSAGISVASTVVIQDNTISNSTTAISLNNCPSAKINYNNFQDYRKYSIYLSDGTSENVDATYNWWGTTDRQQINMSIRDFKFDFNLGKVNFNPFLTEQNPEASPNSTPSADYDPTPEIPEFLPYVVLPICVIATSAALLYRKKLVNIKTSSES